MPKKCSVPYCRSNYNSEQEYTTVFSFPHKLSLRELWLTMVRRNDFVPTKQSGVCIKHFEEEFIIRDHCVKRDDGTDLVVPRNHPILTKNAYPSIFENPLSAKLPLKRKNPKIKQEEPTKKGEKDGQQWLGKDKIIRHEKPKKRVGDDLQQWLDKDKISSISEFKLHFKSKLPSNWLTLSSENDVYIGKLILEPTPKLITSMKLNEDLTFQVWHKHIPISPKYFEWLFGNELKVRNWTAFQSLLYHCNDLDEK